MEHVIVFAGQSKYAIALWLSNHMENEQQTLDGVVCALTALKSLWEEPPVERQSGMHSESRSKKKK